MESESHSSFVFITPLFLFFGLLRLSTWLSPFISVFSSATTSIRSTMTFLIDQRQLPLGLLWLPLDLRRFQFGRRSVRRLPISLQWLYFGLRQLQFDGRQFFFGLRQLSFYLGRFPLWFTTISFRFTQTSHQYALISLHSTMTLIQLRRTSLRSAMTSLWSTTTHLTKFLPTQLSWRVYTEAEDIFIFKKSIKSVLVS